MSLGGPQTLSDNLPDYPILSELRNICTNNENKILVITCVAD